MRVVILPHQSLILLEPRLLGSSSSSFPSAHWKLSALAMMLEKESSAASLAGDGVSSLSPGDEDEDEDGDLTEDSEDDVDSLPSSSDLPLVPSETPMLTAFLSSLSPLSLRAHPPPPPPPLLPPLLPPPPPPPPRFFFPGPNAKKWKKIVTR